MDGDGRAEGPAMRFLKGAALSVWQNSPDEFSQWTVFAKRPSNLRERLSGKHPQMKIDTSPDFWNRYHDDIACARQLGSNSLRLSLEWARIMPNGPGDIDESAVQRYRDILDHCLEAGLEPMVTLHHFVHPQWFQRLGGFEREENIRYFVDWAVTAFRLFRGHGVRLIATFNEPTCAAFTGYIVGIHAPGRRGAIAAAGRVLLHMLRAHTAAYAAIRAQRGGEGVQVGLVHQKIRFEAAGSNALHRAARWTAEWLTHCFGYDVVHDYMLSGRFAWRVPGRRGPAGQVLVEEPAGRPPCDWLGINYYTRVVLNWRLGFSCRPGEVLTDMGWPIVPEGLYDAIAHSAELGLPIYVTETGIADGRDDRRAPLIAAYWKQMSRAVAEGFDVRGFYYWTLVDNYEWHLGYNMKFGLFEWTHAPEHPHANKAAAKAAASAAHSESPMPRLAAAAPDTALPSLRVAVGPNPAGTATATIIGVSPPGTPWRRPKLPDCQAGCEDLSVPLPPAAAAAAEAAAAEAHANAGRWHGRRLRQGALELVRRYAATPDDLHAARVSLAETSWPHVPLPAALMRRAAAGGGPLRCAAGFVLDVVGGVLRGAAAVVTAPAKVANAAWRVFARRCGGGSAPPRRYAGEPEVEVVSLLTGPV